MILLWGLMQDPGTSAVANCLARRGAEFVFVNHADIARTQVRMVGDGGSADAFHLRCGDQAIELAAVTAAYLRPYDHRQYGDDAADAGAAIVHHLMGAWAESTPARVINRPSAEASNRSKLLQAIAIREAGFEVPESLITNEPARARAFQARHGRVVYKSMSSVRSVVRELGSGALAAVEGAMAPVLFQQLVQGTNVRVHVVGDAALACAIETDGVDYRYAEQTRMSAIALPEDIAGRCVGLARQLGLWLAGIDLIFDAHGVWYCLEANPNPAFPAFESSEAPRVAQRVAELLIAG
jgi:glutathione synthase/RimK-type ligase-like ATP-grasp enzyme